MISSARAELLEYHGRDGELHQCGVELISADGQRTVAIISELLPNPKRRISAFTEDIARTLCQRFGLVPERLVLIEHNDRRSCNENPYEEFKIITFGSIKRSNMGVVFVSPDWRHMRDRDWELLGLPIRRAS